MLVLFQKRFAEARWLLLACTLAVTAFCWLRVWLVGRVDTDRFQKILELVPGDWQKFLSVDVAWLITYQGRISMAYDEFVVFGSMMIWSIARGSDCVSGELNRGTLEMLLAQPISRGAAYATQALVTALGIGVIASSAWLGTWCGIQTVSARREVAAAWQLPMPLPLIGSAVPIPLAKPKTEYTPMRQLVQPRVFWSASANLFAAGLMVAGFATLVSACDRYRWRTIGLVVGVLFAQVVAKIVGLAAQEWQWLTYCSALSAYEPEFVVRISTLTPDQAWSWWLAHDADSAGRFGPLAYHALMTGLGLASYLAGAAIFVRRDLPAPL